MIVFEIPELEGPMAHKVSYKYKWRNKENWYSWEKEENLLDVEGEAKIMHTHTPYFLIQETIRLAIQECVTEDIPHMSP